MYPTGLSDLNDHPKQSQRFTFDIPKNIQQPLIQTIIDELNGVGTCPSHGESAARTNWVMEQLYQPV